MRSMEFTKWQKGGTCQSHISSVNVKDAAATFTMTGGFRRSRVFMGLTWFRSFPFVTHSIYLVFTMLERSPGRNEVAKAIDGVLVCIQMQPETDSVGCYWVVCYRRMDFQSGNSLSGHFMAGRLFFNFIIMTEANTTFEVYSIIDLGKDKKSYWHKVGVAFRNSDGSLGVILNSLPVNGTLNIRKRKSTDAEPKTT